MVTWDYFDKFKETSDKYLPPIGEGETMATQIVTAVSKLIYKYYNDGDVFDNTAYLNGWANDLSDYANWLRRHAGCEEILDGIFDCYIDDDYEDLLKELADKLLDPEELEGLDKEPKAGSIYDCEGPYKFEDHYDDDWY